MTSAHRTFENQLQPDALNWDLFGSSPESETKENSFENEEQINKLDAELLRNQKTTDGSNKDQSQDKPGASDLDFLNGLLADIHEAEENGTKKDGTE